MVFLRWITLYFLMITSINALDLDSSRLWLKNSLDNNLSNSDIAIPYQVYKESMLVIDEGGDSETIFSLELNSTQFLANKIITYKQLSIDNTLVVEELKALQNADGGFGHSMGYQSNPLDSALALEALSLVNENSLIPTLLNYLVVNQKSDGSWQDGSISNDTIYVTSTTLRSLWLQRKNFNLSSYLNSAKEYLIAQLQSDGSYGEVYQSALVLRSIAPLSYTKADFIDTIDYLTSIQQPNGSWEDSPYTTALVIQALELANQEVPNPDLAILSGTLIDENTNIPLQGITVNLIGETNLTVVTDEQGNFSFSGLKNGTYLLQIVDSEYANLSSNVTLSGDDINFNTIRLSQTQDSTVSILKGVIKDADTNEPIVGATITIGTKTAVTDSDGNYIINSLKSGSYTIKITKSGYLTSTKSVSIPANTMLYLNAVLQSVDFMTSGDNNLSIIGTVSDANSLEPLEDVLIEYQLENNSSTVYTNVDGNYSILINTPTEATLRFSKLGYESIEVTVMIEHSGLNISLELEPIILEGGENNASISGMVVDSATNETLEDVAIHITGIITDKEVVSEDNGSFNIVGIKSSELNISFVKEGYKSITIPIWLQKLEAIDLGSISLRPLSENDLRTDLLVDSVNTNHLSYDPQTFELYGDINITVINKGYVPNNAFDVISYIDNNYDGNFTGGVDKIVSTRRVTAQLNQNETYVLAMEINTTTNFREQPLSFYIDSRNENIEINESNNYFTTAKSCGGKRGSIDLAVCFDYSGSVGSLANIQKAGLIDALQNPDKFPRDGSIRLTIMTDSRTYLNPTIIDQYNINDIANTLRNTRFGGGSSMGYCLRLAANKLAALEDQSRYKAVTISGDGRWDGNYAYSRNYAVSKGVDVIDVIAIGSLNKGALNTIVYPQPVGGEFGTVTVANNYQDISNSLAVKFKQQTTTGDLTVGKVSITDNGTENNLSINVVVGNAGLLTIPSGTKISVLNDLPQNGGEIIGYYRLEQNLTTNQYIEVTIDNLNLNEGNKVYIIGDVEDTLVECSKENNIMETVVQASYPFATITIQTDQNSYRADNNISITSLATNNGRLSYEYSATLQITDTNNNLIHELGSYNLGTIEANASVTLSEIYQNGRILSGEYFAKAILKDKNGNIVDEATATFRIIDDSCANLNIITTTDKLNYNSSDTISIDTLLINESDNSIANDLNLTISIVNSSGVVVDNHLVNVNELLPNTQKSYSYTYTYKNMTEGNYTIKTTLSGCNGSVIEMGSRSIEIKDDLNVNLIGSIDAQSRQLYVGNEQVCSYGISNLSNQALVSLPIKVEVFDINSYTLYTTQTQTIDINATHSLSWSYAFDTDEYNVSQYSCALSAKINGEWKLLDNALFNLLNNPPVANDDSIATYRDKPISFDVLANDSDVEDGKPTIKSYTQPTNGTLLLDSNGSFIYTPNSKFVGDDSFRYTVVDTHGVEANATVSITVEMPPILIEGALSFGDRGRLLILLDPCDKEPCVEPYNLKDYTPLDVQRAYLETLLTTHGYSYTIVTDAESFEDELRSGNYSTYLSFSETIKLSPELQQELRESVFRGDGLMLAGVHDSRNSILHDAVGIKYSGHYSGTLLTQIQDANYTYFEALLLDKSSPMIYSTSESTLIANYSNEEESNAVTKYHYGNATVLFVGYDLLIHASLEAHYEQLLLELLEELKITKESYSVNELVPMILSLQNQGIATPVRVEISLSTGSIIDTLGGEFNQTSAIWESSLEEEQNQTYSFWIRSSLPVELSAKVISTLDGDAIEQINLTQSINLVATKSLEEIVSSANAITLNDKQDQQKLKQVITSLEKAQKQSDSTELDKALSNLLSATDTLDTIEQKEAIKALRVAIDHTIRSIEIQIQKGDN